MIIQVTKLKALINKAGGQSTPEALEMIDRYLVNRVVEDIVARALADATKRLTAANLPLYMPIAGPDVIPTCPKCGGLDEKYLKLAKSIQENVEDLAIEMLSRMKNQ